MKIDINKIIKRMIVLPLLFVVISCKEDFKVYPITLDIENINNLEHELSINKVDFRYLEKENKIFNKIIFTLNPIESMMLDQSIDIDLKVIYKNKEYKTFQKFLSIRNMYEGEKFTVECTTETMDEKSELFLIFQNFDAYNTEERIEKLKEELPQMKLVVRIGDQRVELVVTNKTKAVYTKVPNHMRNVISMSYD